MIAPTLETDRLILRPFHPDDLPTLTRLYGDAAVMRYVGGGVRSPEATAEVFPGILDQWRTEGLGLWAVLDRDTGALIGECGFNRLDGGPRIELGYLLDQGYWGQGLATEAVGAALSAGWSLLDVAAIWAVHHPDNAASGHVLAKLGFEPQGSGHHYGGPVRVWSIRPAA